MTRSKRLTLACAPALLMVVSMARPDPPAAIVRLTDVGGPAGLNFVYEYSPTAEKYFVESAPGGLAVFDYNGDGRPDIFFTNGAPTPSLQKSSAGYYKRMYRNDGGMRFTDVTDAAGVRGAGY